MEEKIELAEGSYQNLNNFCRLIKSWIDKDMDVVIAISGVKGVGKSTLAMQIAKRYLELVGKNFDVERNVAYNFDQIIERIENLEEKDALIIDEAVNVMMSEDWNKFESKYLKKVFTKLRVKHMLVILCIPNYFWLDRKYRDDMVNFWIYVYMRGRGIIFTPKSILGIKDAWRIDWFKKHSSSISFGYFTDPLEVEKVLIKHPGFMDFISFPKLDGEIYEKYLAKRKAAILEYKEEKNLRSQEVLAKVVKAYKLYLDGKMQKEIARELGVAPEAISYWFKILKLQDPTLFG